MKSHHSLFDRNHILTFWDLNPLFTYVLRTVQMSKWAYKSDLANVHLMIVTTVRVLVHVVGAWQVLLSATLHYNPNFQVLSKNHKAYFNSKLVKYCIVINLSCARLSNLAWLIFLLLCLSLYYTRMLIERLQKWCQL